MIRSNKKGFTIIELLVAVAIIAILAVIIMVSVTTYINGAKVAKIKSDFVNIAFGMSGCFATTGTYSGCITNPAYVSDKLRSDVVDQGGAIVITESPTTAYCAGSVLPGGGNVCIDSTGATTATACIASETVCP
ncbi:MAG: prepilin-type N-terminal cleavage/methylation domain-containing protein [Candidatus Staskawiczbacteria bacterium]|nr:prepilin-type N-terminal cleavage/methylation domain-containing protein [Candidatus Staskawiczbacteria bacterium]